MNNTYVSPFSSRYAGKEMSFLFSPEYRIISFRKLWYQLAKAQKELGLNISNEQLSEMEAHLEDIDFKAAHAYEKSFRHDVMAHIHTFGDQCPNARSIIHLGATSCFVTDNADLIIMKEGLHLLQAKLLGVIEQLHYFAKKNADLPCLSFTHLQPAQPTTVGKRAALWLQDFYFDFDELSQRAIQLYFLGAKGATGTQASFLALFDNDKHKVKKLDSLLRQAFGFTKTVPVSGQTYTRKIDMLVINALSSFAASCHKFATDIRLLSSMGEIKEGFDLTSQVGSSAMPHKQNPIFSERICSLGRFLISLAQNPAYTAATQWLERSLDDSANRRLVLAESFLCADSLLNLVAKVVKHLSVNTHTISARLKENAPQLAAEAILMAAVKRGGDRQIIHETLRKLTQLPSEDFIARALETPELGLTKKMLQDLLNPDRQIGLATEQTLDFLKTETGPLLRKYKNLIAPPNEVEI